MKVNGIFHSMFNDVLPKDSDMLVPEIMKNASGI